MHTRVQIRNEDRTLVTPLHKNATAKGKLVESILHGVEECFEHKIHAGKFIGSMCRLCGRLIGYSASTKMVTLLEDSHCCSVKKKAIEKTDNPNKDCP